MQGDGGGLVVGAALEAALVVVALGWSSAAALLGRSAAWATPVAAVAVCISSRNDGCQIVDHANVLGLQSDYARVAET